MIFSSIAALAEIDLGIAADSRTVAGTVYAAEINGIGYNDLHDALSLAGAPNAGSARVTTSTPRRYSGSRSASRSWKPRTLSCGKVSRRR